MCVYVCMEVQCVNVCICIPWHTCGSQKTTIASLAISFIWIREGPLSLQSTPGQLACEQPRLSGLHCPSHLESTGIVDRCCHIQLCKSPEDPDLALSLHGKCAIYWAMSPTLDFLAGLESWDPFMFLKIIKHTKNPCLCVLWLTIVDILKFRFRKYYNTKRLYVNSNNIFRKILSSQTNIRSWGYLHCFIFFKEPLHAHFNQINCALKSVSLFKLLRCISLLKACI